MRFVSFPRRLVETLLLSNFQLLRLAYVRNSKRNNFGPVVRKPAFCICENKDADQLHSNCATDQRLCFRYIHSTIPLLPVNSKFQASSHLLWLYSPVCVGPGRKPRRPVFSQRGSFQGIISESQRIPSFSAYYKEVTYYSCVGFMSRWKTIYLIILPNCLQIAVTDINKASLDGGNLFIQEIALYFCMIKFYDSHSS